MGFKEVFAKLFRKGGKARVAKAAKAKKGPTKAPVKTATRVAKKPASSKK